MKLNRVWAMPNSNTFSIAPIADIVYRAIYGKRCVVDPFARNSHIATITNDLDPDTEATYHMDALEFLQQELTTGEADVVLFDPPYSPRQVSECYKKVGRSVNMETTQSSYWGNLKKEISRITKQGGTCITGTLGG